MPVVAVASAMAAMVGQNFGAGKESRIIRILWTGWAISSAVMVTGTILCWMFPALLIGIFSNDKSVIHYGVIYLTIMSLGNVVVGTIITISAVFQGYGVCRPDETAPYEFSGPDFKSPLKYFAFVRNILHCCSK